MKKKIVFRDDLVPYREPRRKQQSRKLTPTGRLAQAATQAKSTRKLLAEDGGKEGAKISVVKLRVSAERVSRQAIRAKPGTFEWRYGRHRQDALFHAGSHLARLWERAGIAIASSADFLRGIGGGCALGISDGRVAAIDKLDGFRDKLGVRPSERLIDYCVLGLTCAEIAQKNDGTERQMGHVLHQDLKDCAIYFEFIGTS